MGARRSRRRGCGKGRGREAAAEGVPGARHPRWRLKIEPGGPWAGGELLRANDQLGNLCQIRESRDKSLLSAYKNTTFTYLELPTPAPAAGPGGGSGAAPQTEEEFRMGLTGFGKAFSAGERALSPHLFSPRSPPVLLPMWGVQIFPFPLFFTHFSRCDAAGRGGSARWERSRAGKGHPRAASCAPCALIFPYFHGNPQTHGDPSSPRGRRRTRSWGGCFPDTPKSLLSSVPAHLKAAPPGPPHATRGSRESANMNSYCGKTCCTLIIFFSVVSRLFGL